MEGVAIDLTRLVAWPPGWPAGSLRLGKKDALRSGGGRKSVGGRGEMERERERGGSCNHLRVRRDLVNQSQPKIHAAAAAAGERSGEYGGADRR